MALVALQSLYHELSHACWTAGNDDTCIFECGNLFLCATLATSNNGTGMAHTTAWWGSNTRDEANNRLAVWSRVVLLQESGCLFFGRATDLTNHDDTFSVWVLEELGEAINKVSTVEWVTANTNTKGLSKTSGSGLTDSLISKGTRTRHNTNVALLMNMTWHNTDLALSWLDDTWAVWTNEAALLLAKEGVLDTHHIELWNTLCDAHNQAHLSLEGLHDGSSCTRWWHIDDSCVSVGLGLGLCYRSKNRQVKMGCTGLLWGDSTNHVCSVVDSALAVESSLTTSEPLADNLGILVDQEVLACCTVSHSAGGHGHGADTKAGN
eukprot:m.221069 g.221069  ORF g.221069 m.221069 type:complete len:322 (-) comp15124_c2_seq5:246-1211(-)